MIRHLTLSIAQMCSFPKKSIRSTHKTIKNSNSTSKRHPNHKIIMTGTADERTESSGLPPDAARLTSHTAGLQREDSLVDVPDHVPNETEDADHQLLLSQRQREQEEEQDLNLPPGRIKAIRVPERLSGSGGHLQIPPGLSTILRKRVVDAGPGSVQSRSRSRSPSIKSGEKQQTASTTHDGNSSISSLDEIMDQDILYDRAGFCELEAETSSQRKLHSSRDFSNLPPVNERMTEDTLEDVHAFSDVPRSSNASRTGGSIATGNEAFLEPLNEEDDEDDLDQITEEDEDQVQQVILTNLDNLALDARDGALGAPGTRETGESSLMEEAPSAPTA